MIRVIDQYGNELISYQPKARVETEVPPPATEPPAPADISSNDELYVTGLHLDQYRHATRLPTFYWREALRRDPLDSRCNNALGLWHLRRGEFATAEEHFRRAIARLTRRNSNPSDGEPLYNLGLCLRHLERDDEAYDFFYKATWNQAWAGAGYHAVAEIDCLRGRWVTALQHIDLALRFDTQNLRARNLKVLILRKLEKPEQAVRFLSKTSHLDCLDWWSRHLNGDNLACDLQTHLDIAHDYARAGFLQEGISVLNLAVAKPGDLPDQSWGALPLIHFTLGWLHGKAGDVRAALKAFKTAASLPTDYCFPSRLEEIAILEAAVRANPADAHAPYYLGNLLYDRRRHDEAIRLWERSARLDTGFSIVWRNLGIGYFNIRQNRAKARQSYDKAFKANPLDARLLYERDQLWKRLGESPEPRLREIGKYPALVCQRDDLVVELCALYNQVGRNHEALALVGARHFQPWEGGEGGPLGQYVRAHLALGRSFMARGDFNAAKDHFACAVQAPPNLGEAKHLLANQSDIQYWLGCSFSKLGDKASAQRHWQSAANARGDFQEMSVRSFSEMTYFSALSLICLGQKSKGRTLLKELLAYARQLEKTPATIDYFATSLPTMLLFDDDAQFRQTTGALFLQAQAQLGLGRAAKARALLKTVLRRDPNHALAFDLFTGRQEMK